MAYCEEIVCYGQRYFSCLIRNDNSDTSTGIGSDIGTSTDTSGKISPEQFLCMTCKGILVNGYFQINHLAPVSFSLWAEQCCLDLSSTIHAVL